MINQSNSLSTGHSILPWFGIGALIPLPATVGGFLGGAGIGRDGERVGGVSGTGVPNIEEWSFELFMECGLSSVDLEIDTWLFSDRGPLSSSNAA